MVCKTSRSAAAEAAVAASLLAPVLRAEEVVNESEEMDVRVARVLCVFLQKWHRPVPAQFKLDGGVK